MRYSQENFLYTRVMQQDSDFKIFGLLVGVFLSSLGSAFLLIMILAETKEIMECFLLAEPFHVCPAVLPIMIPSVIVLVGLLILSSRIAFKIIKKLKRFPLPDVPSPRQ